MLEKLVDQWLFLPARLWEMHCSCKAPMQWIMGLNVSYSILINNKIESQQTVDSEHSASSRVGL